MVADLNPADVILGPRQPLTYNDSEKMETLLAVHVEHYNLGLLYYCLPLGTP